MSPKSSRAMQVPDVAPETKQKSHRSSLLPRKIQRVLWSRRFWGKTTKHSSSLWKRESSRERRLPTLFLQLSSCIDSKLLSTKHDEHSEPFFPLFQSIKGSFHPVPVYHVYLSSGRHFNVSYKCTISDLLLEEEHELAETAACLLDSVTTDFSVKKCPCKMSGEMWQWPQIWRGCCPHNLQVSGGTWFVRGCSISLVQTGQLSGKCSMTTAIPVQRCQNGHLTSLIIRRKVILEPMNSG